jgi:hypothetical protein
MISANKNISKEKISIKVEITIPVIDDYTLIIKTKQELEKFMCDTCHISDFSNNEIYLNGLKELKKDNVIYYIRKMDNNTDLCTDIIDMFLDPIISSQDLYKVKNMNFKQIASDC